MKRQYILLGVIGLFLSISFIPIVKGAEKVVSLSPFTHYGFYISLKEGFDLNWAFETYDSPFLANVRIDDSEGHYSNLASGVEQGSGVYPITKDDSYYITLWNIDPGLKTGNIRFTYNEPSPSISGFLPLLLVGIIAVSVLTRAWIVHYKKKT